MLLHDEAVTGAAGDPSFRLSRVFEISFAMISFKSHLSLLPESAVLRVRLIGTKSSFAMSGNSGLQVACFGTLSGLSCASLLSSVPASEDQAFSWRNHFPGLALTLLFISVSILPRAGRIGSRRLSALRTNRSSGGGQNI